jgi:ABC-type transport system substrate-binding protein
VYDGLGARDPMTKGPVEVPQLAQNWTVGSWVDPADGLTKAKIRIIIQPCVLWSDGFDFTIDDVIYTFITMPKELEARGCPPAWWQPTVDQIAGFYRLDWQTVEILMKTAAVWSMNQVVGNIIVPKHIWQPYIATHTVAEISGDFSDEPAQLVGTGPFKYIENQPSTAILRRNPLYMHTIQNIGKIWMHEYGGGYTYANGVTTTAVLPLAQISPAKVKSIAGVGTVDIVVPVTNLNLKFNNIEHIVITLCNEDECLPNCTGQTLADEVYNFAPGETKLWTFNNLVLPKECYYICISIEIVGGPKWEFVHTELAAYPSLWPLFLGPACFGWRFAITVKGDLNEDCYVNIFDIVTIALCFGTTIGGTPPGYNPAADLNQDGYVNILDIVLVAIDFGWTCP